MVRTEFSFEQIDFDELGHILGKRFQKLVQQDKYRVSVKEAEQDFRRLAEPLLVWERFDIEKYTEKKVFINGGNSIGGGRLVEIIAGAEEVVTGVCTVGENLELRAKEELKKGNSIYGMVLDVLANWGVDHLLTQFYYDFREEIKSKERLRSSILMNPGHAGWDITGQLEIYRMVEKSIPGHEIRISDSCMLIPVKSQSFIFGIGKNKIGRENGVICSICEIYGTCQYGRLKIASFKERKEN